LEFLRAGNYREVACNAAGISRRTFYHWMMWGATGEEPFASFVRQVIEAESEAERTALEHVRIAAEKDWKAGAWYLGRKHPERWAERPAPPPETKTAEVAAAELAELLTQAGWKVTPPDDSADGHGAQGEPATLSGSPAMKQPKAGTEDESE
jgi:hypothetical protein